MIVTGATVLLHSGMPGFPDRNRSSRTLLALPEQTSDVGVDVVATVSPGAKGRTLEVLGGALIGEHARVAGDLAFVLRTDVVLDGVIHSGIGVLIHVHEGRVGLAPVVDSSVIHVHHSPSEADSSNRGGDFQWLSTLVRFSIIAILP